MKLMRWFVQAIFWLQAFAAPVLLFGFIAVLVYIKTGRTTVPIVLVAIGIIIGIVVAEYIRRKYGLDSFFGRIYGPNDMDENFKKTK
jgi:hypothetical protein